MRYTCKKCDKPCGQIRLSDEVKGEKRLWVCEDCYWDKPVRNKEKVI